MNVKLLRKVEKHILEEPRRFFMNSLLAAGNPGEIRSLDGIDRPLPDCGTAACIAGWTCVLAKTPDVSRGYAEDALCITARQGDKLFFVGCWPEPYREKWIATQDLTVRANIGKNRIEHFIKTGE